MSVASSDVIPVCAASTVIVRSYGSLSEPSDVSVQLVVTPEPIILTYFAFVMLTSSPESSSNTQPLIPPVAAAQEGTPEARVNT